MTRILFTKVEIWPQVQEALPDFFCCFTEVISEKFIDFDLPKFEKGDALLLSSVRAVKSLGQKIDSLDIPVYCIGQKTANILLSKGITPHFIEKYAKNLDFLEKPKRLIHLCSDRVLPTASEICKERNIEYLPVITYKTLLLYPRPIYGKLDAVVFFSPSGVKSYFKYSTFVGMQAYALGSTTKKALEDVGISKVRMPEIPDLVSLLNLIRNEKKNYD